MPRLELPRVARALPERVTSILASDERRLAAMARLVAGSMLLCMAFSGRLWLSTRLYPLTPLFGIVPPFPWPLDAAVLGLVVGLLLAIIARPMARMQVALLAALLAVLFAQDQSRLWPSFYACFLLVILLAGHDRSGGDEAASRTLAGMRFTVAAIYFWGGVQKLTQHFFHEEFPWFIRPLTDLLPIPEAWIPVLGIGAAVLEIAFAIGLLTRRFRGIALGEAMLMHAVILVCIGPLRGHWNDSAWIWSLTMAAQAWLLFFAARPFEPTKMFAAPPARSLPRLAVAVLAGVMPSFHTVGLWDAAISFNVYTGNVNTASIVMLPEAADKLPAELRPHVVRQDRSAMLDLGGWSQSLFNAGVYPEIRVFRRLFEVVTRDLPPESTRLVVVERATWLRPRMAKVLSVARPAARVPGSSRHRVRSSPGP